MPNYEINYNDKRFTQVETEKNQALSDLEKTYADMINGSEQYYDAQIDASKQWADKQAQLQKEQTDFAIEKIEQQKAQAKKEYTREQSGAYVDWQKQSDQYGTNAEQMAMSGLKNSGFSESSQVSMYNTYQNRVATARESYTLAVQNFNNAITEARLQNNSILAEIAYNALQQQLELSLQGFQYKNTLILDKANKKTQIENTYWDRYQDVLAQINHENALAEQVRQYNATLAEQQRQHNAEMAYKNAALAEEKRQFNETMAYNKSKSSGGGSGGSSGSSGGSTKKSSSSGSSGGSSGGGFVKKDSSGSSAQVDMQSVLALGYGPISAARLSELENQGLIESYTSDGKIKFRKTAYANKQLQLSKLLR